LAISERLLEFQWLKYVETIKIDVFFQYKNLIYY